MFVNNLGDYKNVPCGLVKVVKKAKEWEPPDKTPIPLISVDVKASVVHAVAQVEVTQVYVNQEEQPIEAVYYFPINPEGAVTHFQAELEGKLIKGIVKSQEEAKETYNKAVENQTPAILGEETKADIFKVCVGFLKPGAQAKVIIGYVAEVKNEPGSNAIRFYIPTTIAPRYVSPTETDDTAQDIKAMQFSPSSPASLSVKVLFFLQGKLKSIESPTHKVIVNKTGSIQENKAWEKATVELLGSTTDMDRDFVLIFVPEEVHKPRLYSEKMENGSTAMMLHLIPSFKLDKQKTEIIFVLDRSGSMDGKSIDLAKKALLLFLHSMPADCYFNVVGFGSTYEFLFENSVKYDDKSLKKAKSHAKGLQADLGGTEILEPLKAIYEKPGIKTYLRQMFILTDGEVSNTDAVIGIARANAEKARVFALGIGDSASHYLIEGIAKAGGGTSALVTYKESIDKKVLNQLKNGLQPSLTDIELEWEGIEAISEKECNKVAVNKEKTLLGYNKPVEADDEIAPHANCRQSPKRIPPVYDGSQLVVFGLFKDEIPKAVSIRAQSPDGPLTLRIEHFPADDVGSIGMLHRMAAVKLVRELEMEINALHFQGLSNSSKVEERLKKEIIKIGCDNGITSRHTSFVAVDVSAEKPSNENWVMETRHVPSQLAHGWHGTGSQIVCHSANYGSRGLTNRSSKMLLACSFSSYDDRNWVSKARSHSTCMPLRAVNLCSSASINSRDMPERSSKSLLGCSLLSDDDNMPLSTTAMSFGDSGSFDVESSAGLTNIDDSAQSKEDMLDVLRCSLPMSLYSSSSKARTRSGSVPIISGMARSAARIGSSFRTLFKKSVDLDCDFENQETTATTSLEKLISLQSFDGSYTLDKHISNILGKSLNKLKQAAAKNNLSETVLATALAISFFTTKLTAEKDVWELVVVKARKWLVETVTAEKSEEIIEIATKLVY